MIAIKEMNMPKSCKNCRFMIFDYRETHEDKCFITREQVDPDTKDSDCPLIEIIEIKEKECEEMTKLKPCPFCGGEGRMQLIPTNSRVLKFDYFVECYKCAVSTRKYFETEKDAAEAWNRREGEKND